MRCAVRISTKGRYALASMVTLAQYYRSGEFITVISISEKLGISKIYLEQVFSLLKRGSLVHSIKGAQGGYQLARQPSEITAYEILSAVETSLFEDTEDTVKETALPIESALHSLVFEPLGAAVKEVLENIDLQKLIHEAESKKAPENLIFFI